jgi:hypothetical protein
VPKTYQLRKIGVRLVISLCLSTENQQQQILRRIRPLHDRVVVTRIDAEDKTAGGIIIPIPPKRNLLRER